MDRQSWFLADGTNVFWHPAKTGIAGAKTSTKGSSFYANTAALAGKPCPGVRASFKHWEMPTGGAVTIRADIYDQQEAVLLGSYVCGANASTGQASGVIEFDPALYQAVDANFTGGFCVKLVDLTDGLTEASANYKVMVWWEPIAAGSSGSGA